jgi:predicted phage gp36 major capsid-like protein
MDQQNDNPIGEISTIRDILMGEQMHEYNKRFSALEAEFEAYKVSMQERLQALEAKQNEALATLRSDTFQRLEAIEQQLNQKAESLDKKIDTATTSERNQLGEMLRELGRQLSNG